MRSMGTNNIDMKSTLKTKLDRIFSLYIRLRDANPQGYTRCISCGKIIPWKEADCGHFVNRSHMATRYNEKNCNAQCRSCNRFDEGNNIGYIRGLVKRYGQGVIEELEVLKHQESHWTDFEYKTMIDYYKRKAQKLKQGKGL